MDLNSIGKELASSEGVPMQLESPDGFPMFAYEHPQNSWDITVDPDAVKKKHDTESFPCLFHMVGQDSPSFRRRSAELFKRAQSRKKLKFTQAEGEAIQTVSAGIVDWSHIVWNEDPDTEESTPYLIEYDDANVEKVLRGYSPARIQADEFIGNRANFFKSA